MSRSIGSIFLSLIFVVFLTAPTVISIIDDSHDMSVIYSFAEEEKICEVKILMNVHSLKEVDFSLIKTLNNKEYYFKKYSRPHLNLVSPPPELHTL
jgi:hypothetical protein